MFIKYTKIYNLVKRHKTIYIVRHVGPDPDAVASETALKEIILTTFPDKKVYALGASVAKFKYFGKLDKVEEIDYKNGLVSQKLFHKYSEALFILPVYTHFIYALIHGHSVEL